FQARSCRSWQAACWRFCWGEGMTGRRAYSWSAQPDAPPLRWAGCWSGATACSGNGPERASRFCCWRSWLGAQCCPDADESGSGAMTTAAEAPNKAPPDSEVEPLRAKCGWIIALGVVYVIAGLIALSSVATATVASVVVVGIMMFIAGVGEVINAFQVKAWRKFPVLILLGVLYIAAGFLTFDNPTLAA